MKTREAIKHICPICNKEYYPAPLHIYKIKSTGELVCSYNCQVASEKNYKTRNILKER